MKPPVVSGYSVDNMEASPLERDSCWSWTPDVHIRIPHKVMESGSADWLRV